LLSLRWCNKISGEYLPQPGRIQIVDNKELVDEIVFIPVDITPDWVVQHVPQIQIKQEPDIQEDLPFLSAEVMPEFPGGLTAMNRYLARELNYPRLARELGIEGTVYVSFVVEPDGRVSNIGLLRGIGGGCDEEAIRVIAAMPPWKPGMQSGRAVRVQFSIRVVFGLR
jgi:periplasmic protein TonB